MESNEAKVVPQCTKCKHLHRDTKKRGTCDAFPKGIPWKIISNEHDHRMPSREIRASGLNACMSDEILKRWMGSNIRDVRKLTGGCNELYIKINPTRQTKSS